VTASLDERADCLVLTVGNTLRTPIQSELHDTVSALLARGERRIVLDLSRVSDIDAAGVGELVRLSNMAADVRGVLRITRPATHVRQLLDATGLSRLLIDGLDSRWFEKSNRPLTNGG